MLPWHKPLRMATRTDDRELIPLSETPHSLYDFLNDLPETGLWIVLEHSNMEVHPIYGDGFVDVTCRKAPDSFEWRRVKLVDDVVELVLEMCDDPVIGEF